MIPIIGQVATAGAGRSGIVIDARPAGEPVDGRQTFRLTIRAERAAAPGAVDDRLELSPAARPVEAADRQGASPEAIARTPDRLTPEERAVVERLRARDAQVRQEETAHAAVAGDLAGPIAYSYQRGPDGRAYAVGGSVGISVSAGSPEEVAAAAARLVAAAHAATNPSAADLAVARDSYAALDRAAETRRTDLDLHA